MRLRVIRAPKGQVDGFGFSRFVPGVVYDVGTNLANVMLAEGWAEPVEDQRPALVIPLEDICQPRGCAIGRARD
jgi:hypothetical protein